MRYRVMRPAERRPSAVNAYLNPQGTRVSDVHAFKRPGVSSFKTRVPFQNPIPDRDAADTLLSEGNLVRGESIHSRALHGYVLPLVNEDVWCVPTASGASL